MAGAVQRLPVAELQATVIAPAIAPLPTAVALIAHVLRGGLPELRGPLIAQLRRRDVEALLPLRTSERGDGAGGRPNEIVPSGATIDDALAAVAEVDPRTLAAAIAAAGRAGHPASPWLPVAADPAGWLRAYVQAVRRAWAALEPLWQRAAGALDREVERVSVGLARGAGAELIAERFPYARVAGGALELPAHDEPGVAARWGAARDPAPPGGVAPARGAALGPAAPRSAARAEAATGPSASPADGRPVRTSGALVLLPLVAPASAAGWTDDYGDVCLAIRYAIPRERFDADGPPPASLAALVGPQRALILTRLERPATAGDLAALLHGVPSIASHHLRALERAGLVTREREGRRVMVRRTARGSELVALYSESP